MPENAKKYQIFISSTFEDLKDERRVAMEQILNLGHIPIGMELFQAGNTTQWHYIQKRILDADYYVLIVGDRYGSTLDDGMSYTEREYLFALEHHIPVAAFLMSAKAIAMLPLDKRETTAKRKTRLNKFRTLAKTKTVQFWDTAYELGSKMTTALIQAFADEPRPGLVRADLIRRREYNVDGDRFPPEAFTTVLTRIFGPLYLRAKEFVVTDDKGTELRSVPIAEVFPGMRSAYWKPESVIGVIASEGRSIETTAFFGLFQREFARRNEIDFDRIAAELGGKYGRLRFETTEDGEYLDDLLVNKGFFEINRLSFERDEFVLTPLGESIVNIYKITGGA